MRKFQVRALQQLDPEALAQRISAAYAQGESSAATVVSEVQNEADLSRMMQELPAVEDLLETSDDAPIIRMLNALLTQAARDGASDIHIEPYERHSSVRFRVDGTLREVVQPNRALHAALMRWASASGSSFCSERTWNLRMTSLQALGAGAAACQSVTAWPSSSTSNWWLRAKP